MKKFISKFEMDTSLGTDFKRIGLKRGDSYDFDRNRDKVFIFNLNDLV